MFRWGPRQGPQKQPRFQEEPGSALGDSSASKVNFPPGAPGAHGIFCVQGRAATGGGRLQGLNRNLIFQVPQGVSVLFGQGFRAMCLLTSESGDRFNANHNCVGSISQSLIPSSGVRVPIPIVLVFPKGEMGCHRWNSRVHPRPPIPALRGRSLHLTNSGFMFSRGHYLLPGVEVWRLYNAFGAMEVIYSSRSVLSTLAYIGGTYLKTYLEMPS